MKLEEIVTSLETSKKLYDAGFEAETCFYWNRSVELEEANGKLHDDGKPEIYLTYQECVPEKLSYRDGMDPYYDHELTPAYTIQPLWEVLPRLDMNYPFEIIRHEKQDGLHYCFSEDTGDIYSFGKLSADMAAEAVLRCISEGYIKLEDKENGNNK